MPRLAPLLVLLLVAPAWGSTKIGAAAPAFSLKDAGGTTRSLASLKGKVVVLVVWSSTDPHSRAYGPKLARLQAELAKRQQKKKLKAVFLALAPNRGETAARIKRGKKTAKLTFPVLLDPSARISLGLGAQTTPTACVIGPKGKLRFRGAIDDKPPGSRKRTKTVDHLRNAALAVLDGRRPPKEKAGGGKFRIRR